MAKLCQKMASQIQERFQSPTEIGFRRRGCTGVRNKFLIIRQGKIPDGGNQVVYPGRFFDDNGGEYQAGGHLSLLRSQNQAQTLPLEGQKIAGATEHIKLMPGLLIRVFRVKQLAPDHFEGKKRLRIRQDNQIHAVGLQQIFQFPRQANPVFRGKPYLPSRHDPDIHIGVGADWGSFGSVIECRLFLEAIGDFLCPTPENVEIRNLKSIRQRLQCFIKRGHRNSPPVCC